MEKILDNSVRGGRTIFWLKVMLGAFFVVCALMFALVRAGVAAVPGDMDSTLPMTILVLLLGTFAAGLALLVIFAIQGCYWVAWMYRSVTNLRTLGATKLHPLLAVILSVIPYVGMLIHSLVFREMVRKLDGKLTELGVEHPEVSMNKVGAFAGLYLMSIIAPLVNDGHVTTAIALVVGVASMVCYISALTVYVQQEKLLQTAGQEEIIRRKVDEVLRQREATSGN